MVVIKLRFPGTVEGKFRHIVELAVDYPDAASLPLLIKFDHRAWEKASPTSTNYKPFDREFVDIEELGKILDT